MSFVTTIQHYWTFYQATSYNWDLLRLAGNVVLVLVFGLPVLRVLRRFQQRFTFVYEPLPLPLSTAFALQQPPPNEPTAVAGRDA